MCKLFQVPVRMWPRVILLCAICPMIVSLASAASTLKLVSVLFRHGDRSPHYIYPNDVHQIDAWPDGLSWLTNVGKNEQYEIGQFLRARYDGFLNTTYYQHEQISVESSAVPRIVIAALSTLAGLYPPQGVQVWHPGVAWQPVPVFTIPKNQDNKLKMSAPCPRYDHLVEEMYKSPAIKQIDQDNQDFYEMLVNETGVDEMSYADLWKIRDPLVCERAHNMTWNDWAGRPGVFDKLETLVTDSYDRLYNTPPELAKLKGGPLLKEILSNMNSAVTQTAPSPKFYMYSAHDTTVTALLGAMQVYKPHIPGYGAAVMVELREENGEHTVQIFYRNTTCVAAVELVPDGCESPCQLKTFESVTKSTVPKDWTKECEIPTSSATTHLTTAAGRTLL